MPKEWTTNSYLFLLKLKKKAKQNTQMNSVYYEFEKNFKSL